MANFSYIPSANPILLFPVRLETLFEDKTLKVRIIPDEILHHYELSRITKDDQAEGRRFWVKWFIASGDADREFDTWRLFCKKLGVTSACRIAFLTRPVFLDKFRKGGELFSKRPYVYLDAQNDLIDVTAFCQQIYDILSGILISESSVADVSLTEGVADKFRSISVSLANLSVVLDGSPYIVDYLFEKIEECTAYLHQRLEGIGIFYDRNPQFQNDPGAFDLRDSDYFAFGTLLEQVKDFRAKLARKVISLEEMVDKYLNHDNFTKEFFGKENSLRDRDSSIAPTLPLLPDYFHLEVEVAFDGKRLWTSKDGNPIPRDLQVGVDLESKEEAFGLDGNGDITVPEKMKWMFDYDEAERCGMAITLPITEKFRTIRFNYIYVAGVKSSDYTEYPLVRLFQSHLYWGDDFSLLKVGTATNQTDREVDTLSEDELIEQKYRMEILDAGLNAPEQSDAKVLSALLDMEYETSPFARAFNVNNTELDNAKKANEVLWNFFFPKMVDTIHTAPSSDANILEHIRTFFLNYVNARGIAPAFRIDDQPYSIVPVSSMDHMHFHFQLDTTEKKYFRALYEAVRAIADRWEEIRLKESLDPSGLKGKEAHRKFLQMVAQNPRSVSFAQRLFYYGPGAESEVARNKLLHSSGFLNAISGMGLNDAVPIENATKTYTIDRLKDLVKSKISGLEDREAEMLVCEFLDTFTYRVDVWYMAFVSYYLKQRPMRNLRIGAYGCVFNLDGNKAKNADNTGEYLLAPSIQHALTGAVLRSAYLQTQSDSADNHMCINLSSMRARQALRMVQGIKQGMSTGMILGADLERYFHESFKLFGVEMDRCIHPLRKRFPLTFDLKSEDKRAGDYTLQVINGEALLNTFLEEWNYRGRLSKWLDDHQNEPYLDWINDPEIGIRKLLDSTQLEILFQLVERMTDSYDALNDLLLAEGVHPLVAGDKASFAAIADFMSSPGNMGLPDPAVLQTPMEYAVLAHKVGLALPRNRKTSAQSILATAEPSVNAWLSAQMGRLDKISFFVDYNDGTQSSFYVSNLQEIGMEPLEYLHLSAYPKVLERMLELGWRKLDWNGRKNGTVRILTGDPEELKEGEILPEDDSVRLYEFSLLTDDLASLLGRARTMRAGDIIPSVVGDSAEEEQMNTTELKGRYQAVFDALAKIHLQLEGFLNAPDHSIANPLTDAQVISLFELTGACARAGMYNEAPAFNPELLLSDIDKVIERPRYDKAVDNQMKFLEQLRSFDEALQKRLAAAAAVVPPDEPEEQTHRPSDYVEAIQALTCKNLKVVTHFSVKRFRDELPLRNQTFRSMGKDYKKVDNLTGNAFLDWMDEVAEVRPGMKLYHDIRMMRQFLGGTSPQMNAGIYQVLSQDKIAYEWLGWTVSKEEILDDADSLVMFERQDFNEMLDNAGLIFDSWLEYIPFRKQTAGLVFHCDVPDAEAPQALLYAVHPELGTKKAEDGWSMADVVGCVETAFNLAKIRTVDPEQIFASECDSLLGSLLTGKVIDLVDRAKSLEQQEAALEGNKPTSLVLDPNLMDPKYASEINNKQ